jgi:hypothetical protein
MVNEAYKFTYIYMYTCIYYIMYIYICIYITDIMVNEAKRLRAKLLKYEDDAEIDKEINVIVVNKENNIIVGNKENNIIVVNQNNKRVLTAL